MTFSEWPEAVTGGVLLKSMELKKLILKLLSNFCKTEKHVRRVLFIKNVEDLRPATSLKKIT